MAAFSHEKRVEVGHILSGLVRETTEAGGEPISFLTTNLDEHLRNNQIPDMEGIDEKAQKLLERIKNETTDFGTMVNLPYNESVPLAYAKNVSELVALTHLLEESSLIEIKSEAMGGFTVLVTAQGWNLARNLELDSSDSNQIFVAVWDSKKMEDAVTAITDAVQTSGLKAICVNNGLYSEKIMDRALSEIKKSRAVIVDLTGARDSVFFEAGFAHALGKDTIYVIEEGGADKVALEFYARHYQCYSYKDHNELRSIVENAIGARILT